MCIISPTAIILYTTCVPPGMVNCLRTLACGYKVMDSPNISNTLPRIQNLQWVNVNTRMTKATPTILVQA